MSAGTVASDLAGSADGANRCYQRLPSTERCALAALRACYPDAPTDRLARTAHEAVEAMIQHAGHAGQVVAVTTVLRQAALVSPMPDPAGLSAHRAAETIAAAVTGEPATRRMPS